MLHLPHFLDMALFELACDLQRGVCLDERDGVLEDAIMIVWARSGDLLGCWS